MDIEVAVKNIEYSFEGHTHYKAVRAMAESVVKELYNDEQEFQKDEYEAMLADGTVSDYKEYCKAVGISRYDADYRKPFSENLSHPQIQTQIKELTNQYMCNVCDLPKDAVVTIDTSVFTDKKRREAAVRTALQEKLKGLNVDATVEGFESTGEAEKKDILAQNAYEKVGEMIKSNDFKSYLDLRASLEKYSSNNISLIFLQKPDAKAVMGFNAWKRLDRHVDAGQKGIAIWAPHKRELKTEEQVDKHIKFNPSKYGKPDSKKAIKAKDRLMKEIAEKGKADVGISFQLSSVFDVSQTVPNNRSHDNIMDIVHLNKPLSQDLDNYNAVVTSMKDAATLTSFNIPQNMSQQDGLFEAVVAYSDKVLTDKPHEVIGIKSPDPLKGDMHTIETTMSAYLICAHIGIECAEKAGLRLAEIFNSDKLTEQSVKVGKREMFLKSFDRACCVSDQFNKAFDKSFGYDLEAQREALIKEIAEKQAKADAEQKALRENRVSFGGSLGNMPLQKHDFWEKDGVKYIIAQSETDDGYYARAVAQKSFVITVKNDNGSAIRFDAPPTRETVEKLISEQRAAKAKKAKTDIER